MDEKAKQIETLLESVAEYGKASYELAKLKLLDKSSDAASSIIPHAAVFIMAAAFLIFLNLGLAFWLGEIFHSIYFGFFAVASFYGIIAIVFHFLLHKWLKKVIGNYIIRNVAK